jgi:hypothetical protein
MFETKKQLKARLDEAAELLRGVMDIVHQHEETIKALKYDNKRSQELDIKQTKEYAEMSNRHDRLVKSVVYYKDRAEKLQIMVDRIENILKGE